MMGDIRKRNSDIKVRLSSKGIIIWAWAQIHSKPDHQAWRYNGRDVPRNVFSATALDGLARSGSRWGSDPPKRPSYWIRVLEE